MTQAEWLRLGAHLSKMWPHQPVPPSTMAEWYPYLSDLSSEAVQAAVDAYIFDGSPFPPNAGQIRTKVIELADSPQLWGEVWQEIQSQVRLNGSYSNPESIQWSTEDVAEVVRLKGWNYLCTTTDPVSVVEAQCRELWESIRSRRRQVSCYAALPTTSLRRLNPPRLPVNQMMSS